MIKITINGQTLEVEPHLTVLQAAEQAGITIPTLCYHRDLSPYGGCRLCVVEIQGSRLPATSCTMPVSSGMVVQTETPTLTAYRRGILEMLLYNYYDAAYTRDNGTTGLALDTQFAHWVQYHGLDISKAMAHRPRFPVDSDPNPYVWVDKNKCILCLRCVRACAEIQGRFVWSQAYRGSNTRIVAGADSTMLQSRCESCGACVAYCPTGALDNKMSVTLGKPDRLVTTTCTYCGVGCQFDLNVKDDIPGGRILRVTSRPAQSGNPSVNGMHLCVKGRYGYDFIHSPQRIQRPRLRQYLLEGERPAAGKNGHKKGPWVEVDWDVALKAAADGLQAARYQAGPESIGIIASGRLLNEENYLLNKLARQVLGTNNIDCGSHLAHASTVDGLESVFGLPAMPSTLDDLVTHAQSMLVIGSNTSEQHPVLSAKIRQAVLRWGVKLVVAHPDFVNIAEYASLRLVHLPGTDLALINGLAHIIVKNGWEDHDFIQKHTKGFDAYQHSLAAYTPAKVSAETGVPETNLHTAAEILAKHQPMAILWSVDLVKFTPGPQNVLALVNLGLLLGNMGVPGGGLFPLRSQSSAQGANDMGCRPGFLPGYQPVSDPGIRQKFSLAWGGEVPNIAGMTSAEMLTAAEARRLKALYIVGDDLVSAAGDSCRVRQGLQACDLVILQECLASQTTPYADILLPGVSFAEKTGTYTNTERRIQLVRQAIEPQGEARPDWQIISELARRLRGEHLLTEITGADSWNYADTSQIMAEIAALTPIYTGVAHDRLDRLGQLQWPVDSPEHFGTPTLSLAQGLAFTPQPA